jgi:hypothetical protein
VSVRFSLYTAEDSEVRPCCVHASTSCHAYDNRVIKEDLRSGIVGTIGAQLLAACVSPVECRRVVTPSSLLIIVNVATSPRIVSPVLANLNHYSMQWKSTRLDLHMITYSGALLHASSHLHPHVLCVGDWHDANTVRMVDIDARLALTAVWLPCTVERAAGDVLPIRFGKRK